MLHNVHPALCLCKFAGIVADMPTGLREVVAKNLAQVRKTRGLSLRKLAEVLNEIGHPMRVDSLNRIEKQDRQVTVPELVALALALNVSPLRLLLPVDGHRDEPVQLTGKVTTTQGSAWAWARGRAVLSEPGEAPSQWRNRHWEFTRVSRPEWEAYRDHTALTAVRDLEAAIDDRIKGGGNPERLRLILGRVSAEVVALIGEAESSG